MIRISQLRLPCGYEQGALENKIRKTIRVRDRSFSFTIVRHSVDARKKPQLFDMYTVDVDMGISAREEASLVRRLRNKNVTQAPVDSYRFPSGGSEKLPHRPVVIGAGPAGLFCALYLAEHGYQPLVIERGRKMEDRTRDVEKYWETGILDTVSNVQFGEGGAGTFSDGKLNTQINDRTGRSLQVLRTFVSAGASESILYEGKPHIGTDRLRQVIPKIRRRIEQAGGEVRFETLCTGFSFTGEGSALDPVPDPASNFAPDSALDSSSNSVSDPAPDSALDPASEPERGRRISGLYVRSLSPADDGSQSRDEWIPAQAVVFAVGHSARDTIEELFRENIPLEQKQFAVGFRVAHPQALIDQSQYGVSDPEELAGMRLSASPYKLTAKASSGRGVYSFCMCPGGYIVNASSEQGHVCVNGMSDEGRGSGWANSAIVITVGQKEFGSDHVLAGMDFQRRLEKRAWEMGGGAVPIQNYTEFKASFEAQKSASLQGKQALQEDQADQVNMAGESVLSEAVKGTCRRAALHRLLPADLTGDFIEGMDRFGHMISGFDGPQALVAGVESRTSSPVRIPRGQTLESVGAKGFYPCGEGAGYAGGIMSAAMDGIRIAEAIAKRYAPLDEQ